MSGASSLISRSSRGAAPPDQTLRADVQRSQRHVALEGQVDIRPRPFEDQDVLAVARDADDFDQRLVEVEDAEALADRILTGPVLCRHRLVDDRHLPRQAVSRSSSSVNARPRTIGMPIVSK